MPRDTVALLLLTRGLHQRRRVLVLACLHEALEQLHGMPRSSARPGLQLLEAGSQLIDGGVSPRGGAVSVADLDAPGEQPPADRATRRYRPRHLGIVRAARSEGGPLLLLLRRLPWLSRRRRFGGVVHTLLLVRLGRRHRRRGPHAQIQRPRHAHRTVAEDLDDLAAACGVGEHDTHLGQGLVMRSDAAQGPLVVHPRCAPRSIREGQPQAAQGRIFEHAFCRSRGFRRRGS
mmetsp:Transcript_102947/g.297615  ORF Transcript_102947/g.297615 Transcript_102947/m.297615 type:complete len:232 (-) Transcript_102947:1745-2440(-)